MKYYQLIMDDGYKRRNDIVCLIEEDYEEKYSINQYDVSAGAAVLNWQEEITFYYGPEEGNIPSDYLCNDLGWFIVSQNMKKLFEDLYLSHIQYLPVIIKNIKDNSKLTGYTVANITQLVDGIHHDYCKYEEYEVNSEKIFSMLGRYILNKVKIMDLDIFKLQGFPNPIFVSERVKKEINKRKLTGCYFLEIEVK